MTERRDAQGRGDVWGLGLTVLALVNGREPLHGCTTRSQVEIELFEACKEGLFCLPARPVVACPSLVSSPPILLALSPLASRTAAASGRPAADVAEERGILSWERVRSSLSPALQDFLHMYVRPFAPPSLSLSLSRAPSLSSTIDRLSLSSFLLLLNE